MNTLHICPEVKLPMDTATQTILILARKRVGKTYTASVLAEELYEAGIPFVVLDPTGAWWGLRASADGKHEGLKVIVIGGAHGDVPLEDTAGKVIADLVVDYPGYYVIDFSQFEHDSQIRKFATDFGKRFYFRKESARFPMQLIVDEADIVMPQHPQADQTTMLHTYDNIVRRGGIRGIGMVLITQRPAVLNKNVLTQCETLIQLQMTGSQDVDAVDHWTKIHGTPEERKEFMGSIATLQRGEAWIWSPSWLQVFRKIHIRVRETFNSSATPKAGETVIMPKKMAAVDLGKLGDQIRATVEKAKANDPKELQSEINRLKKDLHSMAGRIETVNVSILTAEDKDLLSKVANRIGAAQVIRDDFLSGAKALQAELDKMNSHLVAIQNRSKPNPNYKPAPKTFHRVSDRPKPAAPAKAVSTSNGDIQLGKAERKILGALSMYPNSTKKKIAIFAGYAVGGGGFNNALGKLRSLGLVGSGELLCLTEVGYANSPQIPPPTGEDLYQMWFTHPELGHCEREILRVLWEVGVNGNTKDEVADLTMDKAGEPYAPGGGGFNNALGKLRSLGVVASGNPLALSDEFFEN